VISTTTLDRIKKTYGIILGLTGVAYLVRWVSGQFSPQFNMVLLVVSFVVLSVSWEFLRFINNRLDRVFPYERSVAGRIALQISIGVVFAIFIRLLIYEFGEPVLPIKLDSLFLAATWFLYIMMSVGLNAVFFIRFFIGKWKESIVETERLEKEKARVQFDNLKNQLNPHFLFNALTSLNSLIAENQELASQFVHHLSRVYRYVLQHKDKNLVTLKTELDFIENYVSLLKTRFQQALVFKMDIGVDQWEYSVAPVTLQILIENAIKHNIIESARPLTISIFTSGKYIVVSNNLQRRRIVETSNQVGLENLKSLYGFLTAQPVIIEQTDERFSVKVPLI
jgi:hypothetical protein